MRRLRIMLRTIGGMAFWFIAVSLGWVGLLGVLDPPVTFVMIEQARQQPAFHREDIALEAMARSVPLAVIASEDQRFMTHHGFSMEQIKRAAGMKEPGFSWAEFVRSLLNRKPSKRVKGASTISQQTAKNVFLWPGRTFLRKGLEVWFTGLIELCWTKRRILEVYLNVAELGKGTFGAAAAAQQCFGKSASRMLPAEAALLATTLPAPRRFNCKSPSGYLRGRQQWVLRQMRNVGDVLDPAVLQKRKEKIEREARRAMEREQRRKQR
ncbi:MAG: monofunctional biosynthetic peptidoglycan transglycosylase [Flavobacteriales bacterium]|nr:monofunctional biosynthetic peptidoglycan transglycosylase [Flavobacteriales bacterium]